MTKQELVDLLNQDLQNEYKHMHFYLHSSFMVQGLHREEMSEMFMEHAASEMKHIQQFAKVIIGLGGVPSTCYATFPTYHADPKEILKYAVLMEEQVVSNYFHRIQDAESLNDADGKYVSIFLEDQLMDSRSDADEFKEMIKGL